MKKEIVKRYSKNPELVEKENQGKLLLFNVNSGVMFELNESARILWMQSKNIFSVKDLDDIIKKEFEESSDMEKDVNEYIRTALKENLIHEEK